MFSTQKVDPAEAAEPQSRGTERPETCWRPTDTLERTLWLLASMKVELQALSSRIREAPELQRSSVF